MNAGEILKTNTMCTNTICSTTGCRKNTLGDSSKCRVCWNLLNNDPLPQEQLDDNAKATLRPPVVMCDDPAERICGCGASIKKNWAVCQSCYDRLREELGAVPAHFKDSEVDAVMETLVAGQPVEVNDGSNAGTSHYDLPEGATELKHLIWHKNMSHPVGELFCSAYRLGDAGHSTRERDLRKIIAYAEQELERIQRHENI